MRQNLVGQVIGTAMRKTVKVRVESLVTVPKLDKVIRKHKNYLAHDETESIIIGDVVRIEACRPLSKRKTFTVAEVMQAARRYLDPETGKIYSGFQREPIAIDDAVAAGLKEGKKVVLLENLKWRWAAPNETVERGRLKMPHSQTRQDMLELDAQLAEHLRLEDAGNLVTATSAGRRAHAEGPTTYLRKMWTATSPLKRNVMAASEEAQRTTTPRPPDAAAHNQAKSASLPKDNEDGTDERIERREDISVGTAAAAAAAAGA